MVVLLQQFLHYVMFSRSFQETSCASHSINNTANTWIPTSQVTLTILVNLSQACCLRPHSLYQRADKVGVVYQRWPLIHNLSSVWKLSVGCKTRLAYDTKSGRKEASGYIYKWSESLREFAKQKTWFKQQNPRLPNVNSVLSWTSSRQYRNV